MKCHWCGREIYFGKGVGWVHEDGGGIYWQRCSSCGCEFSHYPAVFECPRCGSKDVVDDHCVLPVVDEEVKA